MRRLQYCTQDLKADLLSWMFISRTFWNQNFSYLMQVSTHYSVHVVLIVWQSCSPLLCYLSQIFWEHNLIESRYFKASIKGTWIYIYLVYKGCWCAGDIEPEPAFCKEQNSGSIYNCLLLLFLITMMAL